MSLHVYSLADYQLTIGIPEKAATEMGLTVTGTAGSENKRYAFIQIGGPGQTGEGSFVGKIGVERNEAAWSTEGDKTGSWVHNRSFNKTGKITVDLTQISDQTIELYNLCKIYESIEGTFEGLYLTINSNADTSPMVEGIDAYISKQPDYPMDESASRLTWEFSCGQILYF